VIGDDMSAQMRKVTVGQIDRGEALIDQGLRPGERVVIDGQYKLQPGAKVKAAETATAGQTPGGSNRAARAEAKGGPARKPTGSD